MSILQKLINLVAIVASIALLYQLSSNLSNESKTDDQILALTELIGKGESLSDEHIEILASILANKDLQQKNNPVCFLKAYSQIVVKQKIFPQNIFTIFQAGNQFSGVKKCSHYYSLLTYRTSVSQHQDKNKILSILQGFLKDKLNPNVKQTPICLFFYAFNSQVRTKEQTSQIIAQQYKAFNAFVEVDAATDNSLMFAKYTLDTNKDSPNANKVNVSSEKESKGFLKTLTDTIDNKCPQSEIVLVVDRHSVLLSRYSLSLVNQYLSVSGVQVGVFKSLSVKHQNIESNKVQNIPNSYPVLAFRKSVYPQLKTLISKMQSTNSTYQHEQFVFTFLKNLASSPTVNYVDEPIVYRSARTMNEQELLNKLWSSE